MLIASEDEDRSIRRIPSIRYLKKRRGSISAESGHTTDSFYKLPVHPKPEATAAQIRAVVKDISFFRELDEQQQERLVQAMTERRVHPKEVIIKEGEQGDYFYAVDQGKFIASKGGENKFVYDGTGSFGELALLYNSKRAATVMAETEGVLWALDRRSFRTLVVGTMQQRRKRNEAVVQKTPLFKDLTERQLAAVADCLVPETFSPGSIIITQGDTVTSSSKFYIIEQGTVDCFRTKQSKTDGTRGKRKLTRSMGANDVFGEVALLTKVPRQADCVATTDVKCLTMPRDAFERLIGPVEAILSKQIEEYQAMNEEQRRNTGP
ncbi:hypothetical protein Ndes2437B_g03724 [Nannochloris sp. 'desiccata']